MRNKLIIVTLITLVTSTFSASGQKLINSPYSRFNLGTMEPAGSFRSIGMGGIGVSMRENSSIYFSNPASYSSIDTNSFVFDFGLDYGLNILSKGESGFSSDDINFDHLMMGFPLARGLGLAIGIVPVSNGYYKIAEDINDPLVGEYSTYHGGEGGFTSFFLGSGVKINKNFSAGINMTILFGQVKRLNQFDFVDYYNVFHNNSTERLHLGGVNFDYGLQYTASLKNDYFFNAGVSLTTGKNYKSNYEHIAFRYTAYSTQDTISFISDDVTRAYIPGTARMGITFGKKNKFTTGIDFISTKWSASKIPGAAGYTADTKSWLFGIEYIPDRFSNFSYLKRVEYRIGAHIEDNYLIINGEQVKEYGASFGLGIPMRGLSKTNLFFDYTRKGGSATGNLHTESFYTMGVSLNFYDVWFLKRKYDPPALTKKCVIPSDSEESPGFSRKL